MHLNINTFCKNLSCWPYSKFGSEIFQVLLTVINTSAKFSSPLKKGSGSYPKLDLTTILINLDPDYLPDSDPDFVHLDADQDFFIWIRIRINYLDPEMYPYQMWL